MTPTTIKWIAGAAALIAYSYLWFWLGSLPPKLKAETAIAKQSQVEVQQEAKQIQTNQHAEAIHDDDLRAINLTVTRTPIIVRNSACPVPLPAASTNPNPASGPVDPGPRGDRDIRPQIDAFERKYETVLADCRRLAAEWPR